MNDIIDAFLNASQSAQLIIIGFNVVAALLICVSLIIPHWKVKIIAPLVILMILYIAVTKISRALPMEYFLGLYAVPSSILGGCFWAIYTTLFEVKQKELGTYDVEIIYNRSKKLVVNILRGVSVQGAAGSGKTVSVAGWILYWMGLRNIPGLIYDFKDFELVEVVQSFYKNSTLKLNAFAPHKPDKSIFVNPIDPKILKNDEDVSIMAKCIFANLGAESKEKFFTEVSEGAITGAIYALRENHPAQCSYPYLAGIFLTKDPEEIIEFIGKSFNAKIKAKALFDSEASPKQLSAVLATLSNAFNKLTFPKVFYTMQSNSIPLDINNKDNKSVLCLVNTPKYEEIYSPILSVVAQAVIISMKERNQEPSYLLFDEAPTLNIQNIGRIPATMRSFGIATIYMLQDKIQAQVQIGLDRMKEVLANLSTIFFGKTNDPDTAKFFESYFEVIKVKSKTVSKKDGGIFGGGGDRRISETEKDEKTHKASEMMQRKTGEFFVFDENGKGYDAKIKKPDFEPIEYRDTNVTTEREMKNFYNFVLKKARSL